MIVPAARQSEMIPLVGVKFKKKKQQILFMYIYMVRMKKQQI